MNNPTISIIVPVYNVERYVERCIKSLINQTYKNLEIMLVNDGSTDASGFICDKYGKEDNRIKVIHKENGGLSDARNVGIGESIGEYILLVDSDDFIELTMCEELIKIAIETEADLISFREQKVDEQTGVFLDYDIRETKSIKTMTGYEASKNYLYGKCIQHSAWSKLYKRKLFNKVLFPVGMLAEDYATAYLYVFYSDKVVFYDRKLYYYCIRANSIMTQRSMKLTLDVYKTACRIYEFEMENFPNEKKIVETAYANCLLKTVARIYNANSTEYEMYQKKIEAQLLKIDTRNISFKTFVVYMGFRINKKIFTYVMKKLGLNG